MGISRRTIAAIRYGLGFHPGQPPAGSPDALMAEARRGASAPLELAVASLADKRERLDKLITIRKDAGKDSEMFKEARLSLRRDALSEVATRVYQRALSPHQFFERLAAFWADHFAIAGKNAGQLFIAPTFEIEAIRPHIMGRFGDMLGAVVRHPVMLNYLDQVESFGPASTAGRRRGRGLNENLPR